LNGIDFILTDFSSILNTLLPFFDNYPLLGTKAQNLSDFRKAAEIIKNKGHLSPKGL